MNELVHYVHDDDNDDDFRESLVGRVGAKTAIVVVFRPEMKLRAII